MGEQTLLTLMLLFHWGGCRADLKGVVLLNQFVGKQSQDPLFGLQVVWAKQFPLPARECSAATGALVVFDSSGRELSWRDEERIARNAENCLAQALLRITDRTAQHPSLLGFDYHETQVTCCKHSDVIVNIPVLSIAPASAREIPRHGIVDIPIISKSQWDTDIFEARYFTPVFRILFSLLNAIVAVVALRTFVVQRLHARSVRNSGRRMPPQQVATVLEASACMLRLPYLVLGPIFSSGVFPYEIHMAWVGLLVPLETIVVIMLCALFRSLVPFRVRSRRFRYMSTIPSALAFLALVIPVALANSRTLNLSDAFASIWAGSLATLLIGLGCLVAEGYKFLELIRRSAIMSQNTFSIQQVGRVLVRFRRWIVILIVTHVLQIGVVLFALCAPGTFLSPFGFASTFGILYGVTSLVSLYNVVALQPWNSGTLLRLSVPRFSIRPSVLTRPTRTRSLSPSRIKFEPPGRPSTVSGDPAAASEKFEQDARRSEHRKSNKRHRHHSEISHRTPLQERLYASRLRSHSNDVFPDNYRTLVPPDPLVSNQSPANRESGRLTARSVSAYLAPVRGLRTRVSVARLSRRVSLTWREPRAGVRVGTAAEE
eukprot:c33922_g1_i1.p1 GENE.c33922_g1_i1~~c33922_g1_i1.p1  ORF type:complete len:601 (-),score=89.18 c33922_g1_i1:102-1904(-)